MRDGKPGVLTCIEFMATEEKPAMTSKGPAGQCLCRLGMDRVEATERTRA